MNLSRKLPREARMRSPCFDSFWILRGLDRGCRTSFSRLGCCLSLLFEACDCWGANPPSTFSSSCDLSLLGWSCCRLSAAISWLIWSVFSASLPPSPAYPTSVPDDGVYAFALGWCSGRTTMKLLVRSFLPNSSSSWGSLLITWFLPLKICYLFPL